jgi:hypothetical protein
MFAKSLTAQSHPQTRHQASEAKNHQEPTPSLLRITEIIDYSTTVLSTRSPARNALKTIQHAYYQ